GMADPAGEHGMACLQRVDDRTHRDWAVDVERYLGADLGQHAQMIGEHDADHGSVCTSTDKTVGRSRTIGVQLSPASADAYTCPPVVPKYTPHESSESTAIASRSTLR